jgi:hypothetical protein
MGVGIRTRDLRKIYTTPPPLAAAGAGFRTGSFSKKSKSKPAPQVVALEGVSLESFPILQKAVLLNPLVYASEGLRGTLAPSYPHMPPMVIIVVLGAIDAALVVAALYRFRSKAVS